jgi:hypothetical protein
MDEGDNSNGVESAGTPGHRWLHMLHTDTNPLLDDAVTNLIIKGQGQEYQI